MERSCIAGVEYTSRISLSKRVVKEDVVGRLFDE
jgi:hypothetical protein